MVIAVDFFFDFLDFGFDMFQLVFHFSERGHLALQLSLGFFYDFFSCLRPERTIWSPTKKDARSPVNKEYDDACQNRYWSRHESEVVGGKPYPSPEKHDSDSPNEAIDYRLMA